MSSRAPTPVRPLRHSVAVLALAALVLGAVPVTACADGDDCGMVALVETTAGCGGDSCPLAALGVVAGSGAEPPAGSSGGAATLACCGGPELGSQVPALLSADRPEDTLPLSVAAVAPAPVATPAPALPADRTSPTPPGRDRPGGGSVALHRLFAIDLC